MVASRWLPARIDAMHDTRGRAWLAWTAIVVYLLTSLAPGSGLVLCVSADGHVAIEAATADASCFDCPAEAPSAASCCADPESAPGECTCSDIPILTNVPDAERKASDLCAGLVPPADLAFDSVIDVSPPSVGRSVSRERAWLLACPRVPALLVLRV
jgi:hypothetical protein